MIGWISASVILIVLLIVFSIKFKELGHKVKFWVFLIIILVLLGTVGYVYLASKPDLTTYSGFLSLGKSYFAWVGSLFGNMGSITGYAVQQDWGLNSTGLG